VARLSSEIAKALALPEVKQRFADLGTEAVVQDATAFKATISGETKLLSALIRDRKIVVE
jgi:tripartite-type tricarboxylate transporter receptor subunit TctC